MAITKEDFIKHKKEWDTFISALLATNGVQKTWALNSELDEWTNLYDIIAKTPKDLCEVHEDTPKEWFEAFITLFRELFQKCRLSDCYALYWVCKLYPKIKSSSSPMALPPEEDLFVELSKINSECPIKDIGTLRGALEKLCKKYGMSQDLKHYEDGLKALNKAYPVLEFFVQYSSKNYCSDYKDIVKAMSGGEQGGEFVLAGALMLEHLAKKLHRQKYSTTALAAQDIILEEGLRFQERGHPLFVMGSPTTLAVLIHPDNFNSRWACFITYRIHQRLLISDLGEDLIAKGTGTEKTAETEEVTIKEKIRGQYDVILEHISKVVETGDIRLLTNYINGIVKDRTFNTPALYEQISNFIRLYNYCWPEKPEKLPHQILFVGDSVGAGYGVSAADRKKCCIPRIAEMMCEQKIKCEIINSSVVGLTVKKGTQVLPYALSLHRHPECIMFNLGGNNFLNGRDKTKDALIDELETEINEFIDVCTQHGIFLDRIIWVFGLPETREFEMDDLCKSKINILIEKFKKKINVIEISKENLSSHLSSGVSRYLEDNIHFTAEGHVQVADELGKKLINCIRGKLEPMKAVASTHSLRIQIIKDPEALRQLEIKGGREKAMMSQSSPVVIVSPNESSPPCGPTPAPPPPPPLTPFYYSLRMVWGNSSSFIPFSPPPPFSTPCSPTARVHS